MSELIGFLAGRQRVAVSKQLMNYSPALGHPLSEEKISWQKPLTFGVPFMGPQSPLPERVARRERYTQLGAGRVEGMPITKGQAVFPPGSGRVVTRGQEDISVNDTDYWKTFSKFVIIGLGLSVGFAVVSLIQVGLRKVL